MPVSVPAASRADQRVEGQPVHVRVTTEHGREVPELLLWSGRLWSVRKISAYAAAESNGPDPESRHRWRVLVADGRSGTELCCELVQCYPSGHWSLRAVGDDVPSRSPHSRTDQ